MNFTAENFNNLYPRLRDLIEHAEFISIDLEMSGIQSLDRGGRNRKDDNPNVRYTKMVSVATRYSIVQVGICIFHLNKENGTLVSYPCTFYIFPEGGLDIVLSPSSIDFLRKNGMDFNMWIAKGIPYVNHYEEEYLRKKYNIPNDNESNINANNNSSSTASTPQMITLTKPSDIEFMDNQMSNLKKMLEDENDSEYKFDHCNAYLRRYIYQYIECNHPTNINISKSTDGRLAAKKVNQQENDILLQQKLEDNTKSYFNSLGFKRVWKDLVRCKKPVVGHNCLFDLMFLCRWLDKPLDTDFTNFKLHINNMFPYIYDTKYIASSGLLGVVYDDTALGPLYQQTVQTYDMKMNSTTSKHEVEVPVEVEVPTCHFAEGFGNYESAVQLHEAGYDAYCTGRIFSHQYTMLGGLEVIKHSVANKLFMMHSLYHMDLDPTRPNGIIKFPGIIVHITGFAKSTVTDDVINVFIQKDVNIISDTDTTNNSNGTNNSNSIEIIKSDVEVIWLFQSSASKGSIDQHPQSIQMKNRGKLNKFTKITKTLNTGHINQPINSITRIDLPNPNIKDHINQKERANNLHNNEEIKPITIGKKKKRTTITLKKTDQTMPVSPAIKNQCQTQLSIQHENLPHFQQPTRNPETEPHLKEYVFLGRLFPISLGVLCLDSSAIFSSLSEGVKVSCSDYAEKSGTRNMGHCEFLYVLNIVLRLTIPNSLFPQCPTSVQPPRQPTVFCLKSSQEMSYISTPLAGKSALGYEPFKTLSFHHQSSATLCSILSTSIQRRPPHVFSPVSYPSQPSPSFWIQAVTNILLIRQPFRADFSEHPISF
eukprot:gene4451-8865_t